MCSVLKSFKLILQIVMIYMESGVGGAWWFLTVFKRRKSSEDARLKFNSY